MVFGILTSVPITVNAASVDDLTFELNSDGKSYSVIGCDTSAEGELVIPETYNGLPVTSIADYAFAYCKELSSIIISDSVIHIGYDAFIGTGYYDNDNNWENGVLYICNHLIKANDEISDSYEVKEKTKTIANRAFGDCYNLVSVVIPNSVISIGDNAFSSCDSLSSIVIPDSVTNIGDYAFSSCFSLVSITISYSVRHIGEYAFDNCSNLESINVVGENPCYSSKDGVLFNKDMTTIILFPKGKKENIYEIPDGVTTIETNAFRECYNLTSITIPESVTSIGRQTFEGCTSLFLITLPDNLTSIGDCAFYDTKYYNDSSNWESDVLYIGDYLIEAKDTVTGNYKIKEGTKIIAESAFSYCEDIVSVEIPDSVISIGEYAFADCGTLASVVIPDSVTSIGSGVFSDCGSLESVVIPDGITTVGSEWFLNCISLSFVTIPISVTEIGSYAFCNCDSLVSISIPEYVTKICDSAFASCDNLPTISIPNNVKNIGCEVFNSCSKLVAICVDELNSYYTAKDGVLFNKDKTVLIQYPAGKRDVSYDVPDSVNTIEKFAFSYCTTLSSIGLSKSTQKIDDYAFSGCTNLVSITIPETVVTLGSGVFKNCSSLTSIALPNNINIINNELFYGCTNLVSFSIPDSVKSIGAYAFYNCDSFASISIPTNVTNIGAGVFASCDSLVSITIPESVINFGESVFSGCVNLVSVEIFANIKTVPYRTFFDCQKLETVRLPNSIEEIIDYAFRKCKSLATITIPDSVNSIGSYAFSYCEKLEKIALPESLTFIGFDAFFTCPNLKTITIPNNVKNICKNAFGYCYNDESGTREKIDGFIVYGVKGSAAETYAKENGFTFKVICKHIATKWVTDKKATVNAAGKKHKECTECGEVLETATIAQLKCSKPKLSKIENTTSGVKITWGKVSGADSYAVYRKTKGGSWKKLKDTTSTSYTDKIAKSGTTYYYTVRAENEAGLSSYNSTGLSIKRLANPKLTKKENTTSGVKITWGKVTGASGYIVYRKTSSGSWKQLGKTAKTYYTDKTAKSGTTYYYTVRAYSGSVKSYYDTTGLKIKHLADPTLKTPTSTKSGISLKWTKTTGAQGYIIYRKTGSGSYSKLKTEKGVSNLSYVDKSAKKGKTYTYKIKAYKSKTYSAYSNAKKIKDKY